MTATVRLFLQTVSLGSFLPFYACLFGSVIHKLNFITIKTELLKAVIGGLILHLIDVGIAPQGI
jgi:hypothetical protein